MGNRLTTRPRSRRARRTGMSPYQRYDKTPHRYSTAYNEWRARFKREKPALRA